mmetsp:Transcript_7571/g.25760  ORF Transcript_7571/g.25760 Transcript_7571/m.25760 type:complete len:249 (+) Transcript_7571:190-936(+)
MCTRAGPLAARPAAPPGTLARRAWCTLPSHLAHLLAAVGIGRLRGGGHCARRGKERSADDALGPHALAQEHEGEKRGPEGLGGVDHLGPGGAHGLLPAHLEQGRDAVHGHAAPEHQQRRLLHRRPARCLGEGGELVGAEQGARGGKGKARLHGDLGADQLQGRHLLAPGEEPKVVGRIEACGDGTPHVPRGRGGYASVRVLGEEAHPGEGEADGHPDAPRDGHAEHRLGRGHEQSRQLDQESPVVRGG